MAVTTKVTLACLVCKKEFLFKLCELTRKKGAGSFCSRTCKAFFMSQSQLSTSGSNRNTTKSGGKRDDLNGQYFRSGWEANYARYLNWLIERKEIQRWEFEPDTFEFEGIKRGSKFYTPDFKVFENDGTYKYHEVKGWMDAKSKTKLKRMAKYHPQETIVLIDSPVYRSIAKAMKSIIPNWE